jgi:hypothetical protein
MRDDPRRQIDVANEQMAMIRLILAKWPQEFEGLNYQ